MSDNIIKVENLVKEFPLRGSLFDLLKRRNNVVHAVDGVSFAIPRGEVLGLVGESGSGKSTTGRLVLRLVEATSGSVFYNGEDIASYTSRELDRLREKAQIVFQDPVSSLSPRMKVGRSIEHPLVIHAASDSRRRSASWRYEQVLSLMEKVGLSPAKFLYEKYPHQLSGGQSQRAVIARALVSGPDFLVADEPIAMADVSVRALILKLLRKLREDMNLSYLFITHDLATAKYLCDRIAVMYLGRIVEIGTSQDLFRHPHHPYTKALLDAVPVPDPEVKRVKHLPQGEIPSAINPPSGCHFHPRCSRAVEACKTLRPPMRDLGGGHESACILD